MSAEPAAGPLGAPWNRPLRGTLDVLVVDSAVLVGNPLGDPSRRPLYVYSSPGVASGVATEVASVYVLQGFTGQLDQWMSRSAFELTMIERIDALYADDAEEPCPEAVIVLVDAWTSIGGSQFLNSGATGRYCDHICDELVPFVDQRYPTAATASRRVVSGKSSGGYGAMVLPMLRPDVFGSLISHAGDSLFELCYLPDVAKAVRRLRDDFDGSYDVFWDDFRSRRSFDYGRYGDCMNLYAMAAAYSPSRDVPGRVDLPFDLRTGRMIDEVWQRWLEHDPVRMAPKHAEALRGMGAIHIDAGRSDEYHLDLGAQAFSDALTELGVEHTFELFAGRHGGIAYRYAPAIRQVLKVI